MVGANKCLQEVSKLHDPLICFPTLRSSPIIPTHPAYKEQKFSFTQQVTLTSQSENRTSRRSGATANKSVITVTGISIVSRTKKREKETRLFRMIYIELRQSTLWAALQSEA